MKNLNRYLAFTLAEVLITLTIIGVIAALSLSVITSNIKKHIWTHQLKTTFSIMEQGFQKMLTDDGVESLSDTTVFQSMGIRNYCIGYSGECINFYDNMKKYFKITLIKNKNIGYKYRELNKTEYAELNPSETIITLSNGAWLWNNSTAFFYRYPSYPSYTCEQIKAAGGRYCGQQGRIYIDVNGNKLPNTIGRDIFMFEIGEDGHLYSFGSKDVCIREKLIYDYNSCTRPLCDRNGTVGYSCAERIMRNGWKMDY